MLLQRVLAILDSANVRYALVGAVAVASRGVPRSTFDLDLFTTDKQVFRDELWAELRRDGVPVDVRRGDQFDPLGGVVRIGTKPDQIDVVVGKWKWEQAVIERAQPVEIRDGITIPVPSASDLILLKLAAGGPLDYVDAYNLLKLGPQNELVAEISSKIGDLPDDAQKLWQRLLGEFTPPSP
jgi:predicted nucleotidyltransferase